MHSDIRKIISNKIIIDKEKKKYSLIIGEEPSKGARSPKLWNRAYKIHKISNRMYPADVKKKRIKKLIAKLIKDKNFSAAAITNPYKEIIFEILKKNASKLAKEIRAVNCIYKKKDKLLATNTDAEGSFIALKKKFKFNRNKQFLLLIGFGGAGKAVTMAFNQYLKKNNTIFVVSRKKNLKNFSNIKFIHWNMINKKLNNIDLCINCTNIGFGKKINQTPLLNNQIRRFKKTTIIYDIIYNPKITKFLKIAKINKLRILNGINMNLYQAVIGFNLSNNLAKMNSKTLSCMQKVK